MSHSARATQLLSVFMFSVLFICNPQARFYLQAGEQRMALIFKINQSKNLKTTQLDDPL